MIESIHGTGARILELRAKLEARAGKVEYKENRRAIRVEIKRLEAVALAANRAQEKLKRARK